MGERRARNEREMRISTIVSVSHHITPFNGAGVTPAFLSPQSARTLDHALLFRYFKWLEGEKKATNSSVGNVVALSLCVCVKTVCYQCWGGQCTRMKKVKNSSDISNRFFLKQ